MKTAQEVIQDALDVVYADSKHSASFIDRLFHREPSNEKLSSAALMFLTDQFLTVEHGKRLAEQKLGEALDEAVHLIERFSPEEARAFYQKYIFSHEE